MRAVPAPIAVLIPYAPGGLREEVLEQLLRVLPVEAHPMPWPLIDLEMEYGRLLAKLWVSCGAKHRDLMVVEQDIVVPGNVRETLRCREPWCGHSYQVAWGGLAEQYGGNLGLGCIRFRWPLMRAEPDAWEIALARRMRKGKPPGHYAHLDGALNDVLFGRGYSPHRHQPDATHLHEYAQAEAVSRG
jgi:hypothetical protein